jgi:hypothetical protein
MIVFTAAHKELVGSDVVAVTVLDKELGSDPNQQDAAGRIANKVICSRTTATTVRMILTQLPRHTAPQDGHLLLLGWAGSGSPSQ